MIIENAGLDPESLGGNVAVVTHAGQGFGRETAVSLAVIGASVAVVDTDAEAGEETVRLIEKHGGSGVFIQSACINQEEMTILYRQAIKAFGKVDLLVVGDSCVGAAEFLPGMLERRYGVIAIAGDPDRGGRIKDQLLHQLSHDGRVAVFVYSYNESDDIGLAGAGLVGAMRFGREYHGQIVDSTKGLARLGLDSQGEPIPVVEEPVEPVGPAPGTRGAIAQALAEIMAEYETEYDQLSILVRQVAKRMFLQGTGLKIDEWRVYAAEMSRVLTDGTEDEALTNDYQEKLVHLRDFLNAQEAEAQNWVRSEEDLTSVVETLAFRRQVVNDMVTALRQATKND